MATFGNPNAGGTQILVPGPNSKVVSKYTLPASASIDWVGSLLIGSWSGGVKAVIYDTTGSGGLPGALKGISTEILNPSGTYYAFPFSPTLTLPAGDYWLGFISAGQGQFFCNALTNGMVTNSDTYSDGASDPFGASPSLSNWLTPVNGGYTPALTPGTWVGELSGGTTRTTFGANLLVVFKVVPSVSGTVSKLTMHLADTYASAKFKGVIYDATGSGGTPGALLGTTTELVGPVINGNDLTFPSAVALVGGTTYYIGIHYDTSVAFWTRTQASAGYYVSRTYASGVPSTYPGGSTVYGNVGAFWATYAPTAGPGSRQRVASPMILDATVQAVDLAAGAAATNVGTLGGALTGTLPNPGLAALPTDSVGAAQITDLSVGTAELANTSVTSGKLAAGAAASNVGTLSGVLSGTLPSPGMAAGAAATNVGTLGGALTGTLPNPGLATLPANSVGASQITDLSVGTAELADGAVTSAKILDGTIATVDLANNAVTNAKLGTDTARANLLTNGGFEIWQRGTGPFTTSALFTADRWQIGLPAGSISVSKDTTNYDTLAPSTCAAVTYTHSSASSIFQQFQPGDALPTIKGRMVTFSARVRASVPNAIRLRVNDGIAGPVNSAFHTGSGVYETLSITYGPIANSSTSASVVFDLQASGTFYLDNAMLVVGSVPADYAPLHPADELARCLRYYEVLNESGAYLMTGQAYAATLAMFMLSYKAVKPVTPTVTIGPAAAFSCLSASAGGIAITAVSADASIKTLTRILATVASGLVAGNASVLLMGASGAITIEANP